HNHASDVNHLLYSAGKANEPDETFIDEVLNCEDMITAAENKDGFELVVQRLAGDKVDANMLSNIYEEINQIVQESEEEEAEEVKNTLQTIFEDEQHAFKADTLLPKKVKIKSEMAKMSIDPQHLKNVKYITYEGKRCLLLEIEDDVEIEGFQLESAPF